MKNKGIIAAVLLIAVLVGGFLYNKYCVAPKIDFANLALTDLNGKPVSLEDYQNKNRFVNFFETWCGPCMGELPSLNETAAVLKRDNFVFICISDEPVGRIAFLQSRFPDLVILHAVQKVSTVGIVTWPTSYVLNHQSQVTFKKIGVMDWQSAESIKELQQAAQ